MDNAIIASAKLGTWKSNGSQSFQEGKKRADYVILAKNFEKDCFLHNLGSF